jgi:hypothetical protein
MSLADLIAKGKLAPQAAAVPTLRSFVQSARDGLFDAGRDGLHPPSVLKLSWDVIILVAQAALLANDLKLSTQPGHHAIAIDSLEYTLGVTRVRLRLLQRLRIKRNQAGYSARPVSAGDAADCYQEGSALLRDLVTMLERKYPGVTF